MLQIGWNLNILLPRALLTLLAGSRPWGIKRCTRILRIIIITMVTIVMIVIIVTRVTTTGSVIIKVIRRILVITTII